MNCYSLNNYLFKSHRTLLSSVSISWSSFLTTNLIHCVESNRGSKSSKSNRRDMDSATLLIYVSLQPQIPELRGDIKLRTITTI